jgi:hypothetical protein
MGAGHRIVVVIAAAASFAVLGATQGLAQESRAESRDAGSKGKPLGTQAPHPSWTEDTGVLAWEPDRKLRGREQYWVLFARADLATTDSSNESWSIPGLGHAAASEGMNGKLSCRFLCDMPAGVPYRALLRDRYGPIPGAVVDVPPLTAGELRTVLMPLPKELGHARVRVVPFGDRSAVGHKVQLVLATSDELGRFRIPWDSNAHNFSVLRDGRASIQNERLATFWATVACPEIGWGAVRVTLAPRDVPVEETLVLKPTRRLALAFKARTGFVLDHEVEAVFDARGEAVPFGRSSRCSNPAATDSRPTRDLVSGGNDRCLICPAEAVRLRVLIGGRAMDFEVPECAAFAEDARTFVVDGVGELVVRFTGDDQARDRRYKLQPLDVVGLSPVVGAGAAVKVEETFGVAFVDSRVLGVCGAARPTEFRLRAEKHHFAVWSGRWRIREFEDRRIKIAVLIGPGGLEVHGLEDSRIEGDVKPDAVVDVVLP